MTSETGKINAFVFLLVFILAGNLGVAAVQDTQRSEIKIAALVSQIEVPLNRTLELKVTLSWTDDSQRYTVADFENPTLTNFEIVGTSTTSQSELVNGQICIFKDFIYTLKPKELGMGYIEEVTVKVRDSSSGQDETLTTQRIPVKVMDPVPEKGERRMSWLFVGIPFFALFLGSCLFLWFRRRIGLQKKPREEPVKPVESLYLEELRTRLDLNHPNLREDFSTLSKLLRRYLADKFSLKALELTTDRLFSVLQEVPMGENQVESMREILVRSDEIKFSGVEGTREELTRFYTLIEGILEIFLHKAASEAEAKEQHK